ncbi:MAG TPA: DUF3567 domain-containing protein [Methylibium sp.]|jgi:hypothetical protein|nr:DUF3567 domain-containing protein [Methylibium sp.]
MQMLYNSDSFAVVQFDVAPEDGAPLTRGGYEIVDKFARKELFLEGLLAEQFKQGVQALIDASPEPGVEEFDAFIAGYSSLAQQPVVLH